MDGIFGFFVSVLEVWLLFSFLALIMERFLIINGVARGGSVGLVIGCFFMALYKQVYPSSLFWLFAVGAVVFLPLVVNRTDIYYTVIKGTWWWKDENNTK